jgi:hypothetical protein
MNDLITYDTNQTEAIFWRVLCKHGATPAEMLAWFYANINTPLYADELADNEAIPTPTFKAAWYRVRDALVSGQVPPPAQMTLFAEASA